MRKGIEVQVLAVLCHHFFFLFTSQLPFIAFISHKAPMEEEGRTKINKVASIGAWRKKGGRFACFHHLK